MFMLGMMVSSNDSPKVVVNGVTLQTDAILQNDRIFVPVRALTEQLGATVTWVQATNEAIITLENETGISQMIADVSKSVVAIVGNYKDSSMRSSSLEYMAHGTGVIIKSGGDILTNAHVVRGLERIFVVMSDGLAYEAKIKCYDDNADLAVIKIERTGLTAIKFADESELVTGKTVVAIGTPISFSLRNSASKGIISGVNCQIGSFYNLLQTDAAINPGNSGGPLVNIKGELVGINTVKFVSAGIEGMGFSVPVNTVKYVLDQFEAYGRVNTPSIGVVFDEPWAATMGLPTQDGLTVKTLKSGSTAESAGVKTGDILHSVDGKAVHSNTDYNEVMKNYSPGSTANMTFSRDKQKFDLQITFN